MSPQFTPAAYGPSTLVSAYKLDLSKGSGTTVALVDAYDDPNAESDLAGYRTQYGLAACTTAGGCFKKVSQSGSTTSLPAANSGWSGVQRVRRHHPTRRRRLRVLPRLSGDAHCCQRFRQSCIKSRGA